VSGVALPSSCRVALPLPAPQPYTYAIPPELADRVVPGTRVVVPVRGREMVGLVTALADEPLPEGVAADNLADGWLTAEEISQLDLRGTELVVLSACESNRGKVATGEAVAGLRSAFLFAGAKTLVGSLYEVPDEETRELMHDFYAGLCSDKGKLESLNAARRAMIDRRRKATGAAHPFFWSSFVLVGQP